MSRPYSPDPVAHDYSDKAMALPKISQVQLWNDAKLLENLEASDPQICKLVQGKMVEEDANSKIVAEWLKWCQAQTSRVIVTGYDVPAGVLPTRCNGCLYDIKVGGKRRAPDDELYNKNPDLRYVPI